MIAESFNIRSWMTGFSGSLFAGSLAYETGTSPRWDGKISETSWLNPGETSDRGHRYSYGSLSRLTAAEYADASGSGLFTERYGYDLNGNMTSRTKAVQLTDSSGNTTLANLVARNSYTGNRVRSMPMETVTYDACGRLTGASSGKVRSIRYNEIGLPQEMTLSDGSTVNVVYAADGRKLRERVTTGSSSVIRNYSGNCIYEGSVLKKVLFDGGYAQMSGSTPSYMFFLTDHLGSVRVVADENGSVRQVNQYYPYGDLIEDARMVESTSDNRYRFTGKELATETGLYDFCARYLETSMGRFTTIDPLAEKYPSISPYAYCAGDPVNSLDVDGRDIWRFDSYGNLVDEAPLRDDKNDVFMIVEKNDDGEWKEISGRTVYLPFGSITQLTSDTPLFSFTNDKDAQSTFEIMARNTNVEWSFVTYSDGINAQVGTSNKEFSNAKKITWFN